MTQSTELDLYMSNLSFQEEDPITRNRELFKVLLLHKFPGCTVIDYHNRLNCREDEELYITDFYRIFNILDSSRFEAYVEQADQYIKEYGYSKKDAVFALGPWEKKVGTITYLFAFLTR